MENPLSLDDSLLIELIICVIERDEKLIPNARNSNPIKYAMFCKLRTIVSRTGLLGSYNEAENHRITWLIIIETKPMVSEVDLFRYLSEMYPISIGIRYAKP